MPAAKRPNPRMIIFIWSALLIVSTMILPAILVMWMQDEPGTDTAPIYELPARHYDETAVLHIPVYLTGAQQIEHVPLEHYVRGVIAAEMPEEFELEALKAQAIAARTYILRKIIKQDFAKAPIEGAWVSDTAADQAYVTEAELLAKWGRRAFAAKISKLNRAVEETRGLILTYEGEPIDATYFSTSNGYTENAEEYWSNPVPYLRSVASPWDVDISPKYRQVTEMTIDDVMDKLGLTANAAAADDRDGQPSGRISTAGNASLSSSGYVGSLHIATAQSQSHSITPTNSAKLLLDVMERTSGQRIKTIQINDVPFSGREVREKLGLPSAAFTWELTGESIAFTTYGYGHGVGMSQYGAQGMAREGHTAKAILSYYYQGVSVVHMDQLDGWQKYAIPIEDIDYTGQEELSDHRGSAS